MRRVLIPAFVILLFALLNPSQSDALTPSTVDPDELAKCLTNRNFVMYGKEECSACAIEKSYFGASFSNINYIDCGAQKDLCEKKEIRAFPTWEDKNGKQYKGAIPLEVLADLSGCSIAPTAYSTTGPQTNIKPTSPPLLTKQAADTLKKDLVAAYIAGLISFFAPCLLPLFPAYFSVITGYTFADLYGLNFEKLRSRIFISSLFFVAGFSLVFTVLGATGSIVGQLLSEYLPILLRISGFFLIILGAVQVGIFKIPALEFDFAWNVQRRLSKLGYASATTAGVASALSWIPCIGPLLASVLLLAAKSQSLPMGLLLLFTYSMGLTTPFLLASLSFPRVVRALQDHRVAFHRLSVLAGIFLIAFGIVLLADKYRFVLEYYYRIIGKVKFSY